MSSSCVSGPAGIEISKNVFVISGGRRCSLTRLRSGRLVSGGLAVDHVEENLSDGFQAFLTAFVRCILRRMPEPIARVGIVEIDQIDRLDARLVQREMVVEDSPLHLIGK